MALLLAEFLNADGEHSHDTSVSSVSITNDQPVDFGLFDEWTSGILQKKGTDMYRMKGVVNARCVNAAYACDHTA